MVSQLEDVKKSVISDFNKGIEVNTIIKSISSNLLKKTECKQFVFEVIYDYLMLQKKNRTVN